MRWAKSYSIVDHRLLHGGYFQKLSHEALVLYLFLIVVGDKNGRSFYADPTIAGILHLSGDHVNRARNDLTQVDLIDYRRPYWWVKNLEGLSHERPQTKSSLLQRHPGALLSSDPEGVGDLAKESFQTLLKNLGDKNETPLSAR